MHGNLINGKWIEAKEANRNINPSNLDDVVGEYARADAAQAREAIAAARAAFRSRSSSPGVLIIRAKWKASAPCSHLARGSSFFRLSHRSAGMASISRPMFPSATPRSFRSAFAFSALLAL